MCTTINSNHFDVGSFIHEVFQNQTKILKNILGFGTET